MRAPDPCQKAARFVEPSGFDIPDRADSIQNHYVINRTRGARAREINANTSTPV